MRAAPAVDAALDAGVPERMLILLLHGLAGVTLALWAAAHAALGFSLPVLAGAAIAGASMAALGAWLARRALPADAGRLRWDGQGWSWQGPADLPLARLEVSLDLGVWALLRLHPADGTRPSWRVASRRGAGAAWHGLRVALAAHAGAPVPTPADRQDRPGAAP
ncbi:MAG: hypothetical protein Q7U26_05325 [Aquabacterium sp.]|nr:hypothetical protein [Aquabacterium sp.]